MSIGIICFSIISALVILSIIVTFVDVKSMVPPSATLDRALSAKRYDESFIFNLGQVRIRHQKKRSPKFVEEWTRSGNTIQD